MVKPPMMGYWELLNAICMSLGGFNHMGAKFGLENLYVRDLNNLGELTPRIISHRT